MKFNISLVFFLLITVLSCKRTQLSGAKNTQSCAVPAHIGEGNKDKLILALKEIANDIPTIKSSLSATSNTSVRSAVTSILEPLSKKIRNFYDEVRAGSESISAAVVMLKNPEIMAEEAKLLSEIKSSLKNFDPTVQKQVTKQVNRMIERAQNLRSAQLSEQLNSNLMTAMFLKAGSPKALDILPDGQGNFRVMLRKNITASQNPLQPAGETIPIRKNRYTYKLHEHAGSVTAPHLMSDYLNKTRANARFNPWDRAVVDNIFGPIPKSGATSEKILAKFFDSLHGNLYGARLRNNTLISEDWGILQKGYLRKNGFTDVLEPGKIDVAFYRPKRKQINTADLKARIDDLLGNYRSQFGDKFPQVDSAKLVETISERLAKSSDPIINNNRLTRDEWFRMTQRDPFIKDKVSGIELVPRLCKGANGLTLLNHNRVEASQGLGFHIEINMSKDCNI